MLKHHIAFKKQLQLYPAWCLHEAHIKQPRCYENTDGGIRTRTKVSWNLQNLNQITFFFFLRNEQITIVMGHNREQGLQNLKPVMLCLECLFLCLVWLKTSGAAPKAELLSTMQSHSTRTAEKGKRSVQDRAISLRFCPTALPLSWVQQ